MKYQKINKTIYIAVCISVLIASCTPKAIPIQVNAEKYFDSVDLVTQIMVHDIFSPPVASRIYVYPNIAAYEIIAQNDNTYQSLSGQINELTPIPKPESEAINYKIAAIVAHLDVSKELVFSEDKIIAYSDSIYHQWGNMNKEEFIISKEYGLKVAEHIKKWMHTDKYKQTRTMPKYAVNYDVPERWQPTPPAYMDGIEPHWNKIRPLCLQSASQFKPIPPPKFSLDTESDFYKELKEVYDVSTTITKKGDTADEIKIAQFWDCNPYVSVNRGHLMFATKKITPGAHWVGISKIAAKLDKSTFNKTVYMFTKVTIAIADGFISCWDEKYRSNLIRPETLINQHLDENWKPILQTPPFPEYVSGHSVVSGAAAEVLTNIFGDNFSFRDITEEPYGIEPRNFSSFRQAAKEAAISRLYGGIHYRSAIDVGLKQGIEIGGYLNSTLKMKK